MADIARLFDFTPGQPAKSGEVDAEFNQLIDTINALDNANLSSNAAIALSKLAITPMVRVQNNNQTIATGGTAAAWSTETYDTDTMHDNAANNSRLTCKTAGVYRIWLNGVWDPVSANDRAAFVFRLNGSTNFAHATAEAPTNTGSSFVLYTEYALAVNDYVEVVGTALVADGTLVNTSVFGMSLISRAS